MATKKIVAKQCDHLYLLLDSVFRQEMQRHQTMYKRMDIFYCQKCLAQECLKKEEVKSGGPIPDWFDMRRSYMTSDQR